MSALKLVLLALAVSCFAAPKLKDYKPKWKSGQSWRVEYIFRQPSAAASADPGSETRREIWSYQVAAHQEGWRLTIRELRSPATTERYEVTLDQDLAVKQVKRFNHLNEGYPVYNDIEEGNKGFRADSENTPLLDWPDWTAGRFQDNAYVMELEKRGYSSFRDSFRWKKGKPWWSEAERRFGDSSIKARLFEAD